MELFKVHKGSWSYPEEAYTKFFGVPLYSGFMYASVASYMCQAWHWFNLKIDTFFRPAFLQNKFGFNVKAYYLLRKLIH